MFAVAGGGVDWVAGFGQDPGSANCMLDFDVLVVEVEVEVVGGGRLKVCDVYSIFQMSMGGSNSSVLIALRSSPPSTRVNVPTRTHNLQPLASRAEKD